MTLVRTLRRVRHVTLISCVTCGNFHIQKRYGYVNQLPSGANHTTITLPPGYTRAHGLLSHPRTIALLSGTPFKTFHGNRFLPKVQVVLSASPTSNAPDAPHRVQAQVLVRHPVNVPVLRGPQVNLVRAAHQAWSDVPAVPLQLPTRA